MTTTIAATFDVTDWDEHEFDRHAGAGKLTKAKVTKSYHGDISAKSLTEWLMSYGDDGTASFVGLERIIGTVGEREGTLVVQHVGRFEDGAAKAELTVVAGSCSGDLSAARGSGTFVADPAGKVSLQLSFA
jgi:hypothetical protein